MSETSKEHTDIFRSLLYIIKYCKKECRVPEFRLFFSLGNQTESSNQNTTSGKACGGWGWGHNAEAVLCLLYALRDGLLSWHCCSFWGIKKTALTHLCKAAACPGAVPGAPLYQGTLHRCDTSQVCRHRHLGRHKTCSCLLKSNPKLSEKDMNWVEFSYI